MTLGGMADALKEIRALAASYPGAERAFLFGDHEVYRVKKKVYLWLGDGEKGGTWLSVKLKDSQPAALTTTNANRHSNVKVGTTQRSIAAIASAWLRRNVRQFCDGGPRCRAGRMR